MENNLPSIREILGSDFIEYHFSTPRCNSVNTHPLHTCSNNLWENPWDGARKIADGLSALADVSEHANTGELVNDNEHMDTEPMEKHTMSLTNTAKIYQCHHEYCSKAAVATCAIHPMTFRIHPKCSFAGGKVPDGCSKPANYGYFKPDGIFINLYCSSHKLTDMLHGSGNKSPKVERRKGGILYICNYGDCDKTVAYRPEGNFYCSYHAKIVFGNAGTKTKSFASTTECCQPGCKAGALYGKHINAIYYCAKHNHENYYRHKRYMCAVGGCEKDIEYYDHILKSNYCADHIDSRRIFSKITNVNLADNNE